MCKNGCETGQKCLFQLNFFIASRSGVEDSAGLKHSRADDLLLKFL